MSKEKNKNTFRIGALLLVACLISSVMLSGTFAKYTSEYAGQDTALVARWSFTGNFDDEDLTADMNLPIWDHSYTTYIYEQEGDDYIIAPGIQGEFDIDFSYDADVDADLVFNFTKSGNYDSDDADAVANEAVPVPIQYSIDGFNTIYYDLDDLEDAIIDTATTDSTSVITGDSGSYVITHTAAVGEDPAGPIAIDQTVSWRWPYDVSQHIAPYDDWTDEDDTAIGNISKTLNRGSYILNLVISATQKVPE